MSAHGLAVFDKTLHVTHDWLNDISTATGADRKHAWNMLSVVLGEIRTALPRDLAAHLGAELPLLVRGAYYRDYRPADPPRRYDPDLPSFVDRLGAAMASTPAVNPLGALAAVLATISRHVPHHVVAKVQGGLPAHLKQFWTEVARDVTPPPEKGGLGSYSAGGRRGQGEAPALP